MHTHMHTRSQIWITTVKKCHEKIFLRKQINRYLILVLYKTVPGEFSNNLLFFYFMLEENCGFKDRVAVISVCFKEHSRYHGDDDGSIYWASIMCQAICNVSGRWECSCFTDKDTKAQEE